MINIDLPPVLKLCFQQAKPGGSILTLGRQTVGFGHEAIDGYLADGLFDVAAAERLRRAPLTQETVLEAMGFGAVHSLDVSDYEGCTHVFDLNRVDLPSAWRGAYSVVYDGGTLEHVFDFATALRNCIELLEPLGLFVHIGPMNNWPDHGFYQFSPTLWFDVFVQNGFELLASARIRLSQDAARGEFYAVDLLPPYEAASQPRGPDRDVHVVVARKPAQADSPWRTPSQSIYDVRHGRPTDRIEMATFHPFVVVGGRIAPRPARRSPIAPDRMVKAPGGARRVEVRDLGFAGGTQRRPFRSPLVVMEDDAPLPFVACSPEAVAEGPPGRFCQRGWWMYFTASDGSDPRANGRRYELRFPVD
ncbi:MAG TPA: hypothetical protein PKA55_06535 [Rhodoblastus sp.]|nr:hypothetical protein [Rhodoblastus sp.]